MVLADTNRVIREDSLGLMRYDYDSVLSEHQACGGFFLIFYSPKGGFVSDFYTINWANAGTLGFFVFPFLSGFICWWGIIDSGLS